MKKKLPIIPFVSPPAWYYTCLKAWLEDRKLDQVLQSIQLPAVPKARDTSCDLSKAARPYDRKSPRPGEVRLLAPDALPAIDRPVYVAVLSAWAGGGYLVAPFSRYVAPATPGEWLTGRANDPLRVLSLWNARVVDAESLGRSWIAAKLTKQEISHALAVFRHVATGAALPAVLERRVGPPILVSADPRVIYQQELATLLAPLAAVPEEAAVPVLIKIQNEVKALWDKVAAYCRDAAESRVWQPAPVMALAQLKGAGKKESVALIQVQKGGRRRVVARVVSGIALPSPKACWRLSPAMPRLAGRRFAVCLETSPDVLATGVVNRSGGRLDVEQLLKTQIPEGPVVLLLLE